MTNKHTQGNKPKQHVLTNNNSEEQRWTLTSDRCEGCEYLPQARNSG